MRLTPKLGMGVYSRVGLYTVRPTLGVGIYSRVGLYITSPTNLGDPKVCYLHGLVGCQQQVPWFDVFVHHPLRVQVLQTIYQLDKVPAANEGGIKEGRKDTPLDHTPPAIT